MKELIPTDWIKAVLLPILKKGDGTCYNNHRKISLLEHLGEIFHFLFAE